MSWTPTKEQKDVIDYDGNLVVIAKPGSGKTYVMSEKIRKILPALPDYRGVIAISYTNKASGELNKRSTHGGIDSKASFFGTIDKFCDSEIIIPFLSQLWGKPKNEIQIYKINCLSGDEQEQFSTIKTSAFTLADISNHESILKSYYEKGILFLETTGALALYTIERSLACRNYLQARYVYLFIDEYQDSGQEQHELFLKLQELGLIAVAVGDADQSIFGFSDKDSKYLLSLPKRPEFKHFIVSYNHRCHPSIINYSQALLDEKVELITTNDCRVFEKCCVGTQEAIAQWIDNSLPAILKKYHVENNSEVGILVRSGLSGNIINENMQTNHRYFTSHPLEEHFSLWARLFCQLLYYRFDNKITAQEIIDECLVILSSKEKKTLRKNIEKVRTECIENLGDLMIVIASAILPRAKSEEAASLLKSSLNDNLSSSFEPAKDNEAQVMTLHKSKGLEFDIVFHLDLYEWVFPSKRPGPGNDFNNPKLISLEQDVNLHYVGITRARKACFLCTSSKRIAREYNSDEMVERKGSNSEFLSIEYLNKLREKTDL